MTSGRYVFLCSILPLHEICILPRGSQVSYEASCERNYRNCFADIGGVEWLPASVYLSDLYEVTQSYHAYGLCNATSPLYNAAHCALCDKRTGEVYLALLLFVLVLEHLLVACKLGLVLAIPERPVWVRKSEASNEFAKELMLQATEPAAATLASGGGRHVGDEGIDA